MDPREQDKPIELSDEMLDHVTGGGKPPNPGYGLLTAQNQTPGSYNASNGYYPASAAAGFSVGLGKSTK
jgi:hypothetical protein